MTEMSKLTAADIASRLTALDDWTLSDEGKLCREIKFKDFTHAFSFMTGVALIADKMNHHPDWFNSYSTLKIALSSHDVSGLSEQDFILAKAIDELLLGWRLEA